MSADDRPPTRTILASIRSSESTATRSPETKSDTIPTFRDLYGNIDSEKRMRLDPLSEHRRDLIG